MAANPHYLVFGPAYLDIVVETDRPLAPGSPHMTIDQSALADEMRPGDDGCLHVVGPTGDHLTFSLPPEQRQWSATYLLAEPIFARLLGANTMRTVAGGYPTSSFRVQLGGMGAGYAKAFDGLLRAPFGATGEEIDGIGRKVLSMLAQHQITISAATVNECESDTSLLLLSQLGDKLAVGVRAAVANWTAGSSDLASAALADALVFCGAPNALMADVVAEAPHAPVMCAPALRNVTDLQYPLAGLSGRIHYLSLNVLEWVALDGQERMLEDVPVITVTDGPRGSTVYCDGESIQVPAVECQGPVNANRAGETYGSTFFKVLMAEAPDFHQAGSVSVDLAEHAARIAASQAARQLRIEHFAFPPDDWREIR